VIACVYAYMYARLPAYSSDTEMVTVHKDGEKKTLGLGCGLASRYSADAEVYNTGLGVKGGLTSQKTYGD